MATAMEELIPAQRSFPLLCPRHCFLLDSLATSQCKVLQERRTGSTVCLVGCMHFNPFSTFLARRVAQTLAENQTLKAIVLEMFDQRWDRMLELHSDGEMRLLFDNEMQAVAEIANASGVPITFADLSDEELDMVFDGVINETLADVQEPFSGWMRIWTDLTGSIAMLLGDGNSSSSKSTVYHFISSLCVLLTTPIALLRNVLVLIMEAPFSNTAWLLLIFIAIPAFLLTQTDTGAAGGAATSSSGADGLLNLASLLLMLPMLALWRILLRAIIRERDSHIAEKIRQSCDAHETVLVVLGSLHVPGAGDAKSFGGAEIGEQEDLLPTRLRVRARLARARAGAEGARRGRPLLDQATLQNLQKAIKRNPSTMGSRVINALEKVLSANGVKARRVTLMKINNFKDW
eukprot:s3674_g4.t1